MVSLTALLVDPTRVLRFRTRLTAGKLTVRGHRHPF